MGAVSKTTACHSSCEAIFDELVEGGHLFGAGRVELLGHDLDGRFGPAALAGIVQDAGFVGFGRRLRVDLGRPQVGQPGHRRGLVAHRHAQHVAQVGGRVGGQQQGFVALPRQPDGGDARGDRLAHAALAGKEHRPAVAVGLQARQARRPAVARCVRRGWSWTGSAVKGRLPTPSKKIFAHLAQSLPRP